MKKYLVLILTLVFSFSFTNYGASASAAAEDKIKAEVTKVKKKVKDGRLVFRGDTNLPKKTKLLIKLDNKKLNYHNKMTVSTKTFGKFKSQKFADGKDPLFSGTYTLTIQTLPASEQIKKVKTQFGKDGKNLKGDLIKKMDNGNKVIEYVELNVKVKSDRINPEKPVKLENGEYTVGEKILPGKYVVSTESEMGGNFFVAREEESEPGVNEILGTKLEAPLMYNNLKVELKKGDQITLKSFDGSVTFTPVSQAKKIISE